MWVSLVDATPYWTCNMSGGKLANKIQAIAEYKKQQKIN